MTLIPEGFRMTFWSMSLIAAGVYGLHLYREEGYDEGYAVAEAQGLAALATLRESHATEQRDAALAATSEVKKTNAQLLAEQQRGNHLANQLADTQIELRSTTERLTGEIALVTQRYRRALDQPPEPLPAAVFTAGFVRVWNSANSLAATAAVSTAAATGRVAAPTGATVATDQLDSGITQGDLLTNHTRNAELHASCRAQLNGLIDWASAKHSAENEFPHDQH